MTRTVAGQRGLAGERANGLPQHPTGRARRHGNLPPRHPPGEEGQPARLDRETHGACHGHRLGGFGERFPRHLSGGQRKRVAIAQVLVMNPRLLLMDEPFASLDAIVRARVIADVAELVERERISALLVTHDLEEAISLSDVVYLLSQGPRARIIQQYEVPIPRPRDPLRARMHPAFARLHEKLWSDLSREVGRDGSEQVALP